MSFEKLPPVEGSVACLTCNSGAHSDLNMDRIIAVGFGDAGYTKDGIGVWSESDAPSDSEEDFHTVADVERLAAADPDHDWRIYFYSPMYEAEYQRQGEGAWVLVKKGEGFA